MMASFAAVSLGAARVRTGAVDQGLSDLRFGINGLEQMKVDVQMAAALIAVGETYLLINDVGQAFETAERALVFARRHQQHATVARALLLLGEAGVGISSVGLPRCHEYLEEGLAIGERYRLAVLAQRFRDVIKANLRQDIITISV